MLRRRFVLLSARSARLGLWVLFLVKTCVISGIQNFQVFYAVIASIPVLVMHMLTPCQLALKMGLHNLPVFVNSSCRSLVRTLSRPAFERASTMQIAKLALDGLCSVANFPAAPN